VTTSAVTPSAGATTSGSGGCVNPTDDHGDDFAAATPIDFRSPFAGVIEVSCDTDAFVVNLQVGVSYDLETITPDDTTLTILDRGGFPVAFNDNAGAGLLSSRVAGFVPQVTDDYLVLVNGFTAALPSYTLRVYQSGILQLPRLDHAELFDVDGSSGATQGDVLVLTFNEPVRLGAIPGGAGPPASELDLPASGDGFGSGATITSGAAAEEVHVTLGTGPSLEAAGVFDGTSLQAGDSSGVDVSFGSSIESVATSLPPGRWTVDISLAAGSPPSGGSSGSTAGGGGSSQPADDHGNDAGSATFVFADAMPFSGSIETGGDEDWFKVTLQAGQDYTFQTETSGDDTLEVVDSSGNRVAYNDDVAAGQYNAVVSGYVPPADGVYYLIVRGYGGYATPDYVLRTYVTAVLQRPRLTGARFVDTDGSGGPTSGDAIEVTFSEEVMLTSVPSGSITLATGEFVLPVVGDDFGQGADVVLGPMSTQVTVRLGAGATFQTVGAFDGRRVSNGAPAGIDVSPTSLVAGTQSNSRPARWATDLE
jgi:hypothetical protein